MTKYVIAIYSFVILVALAGIFTTELFNDTTSAEITANAARQKTQGVMIGKTTSRSSYVPQQKKATTGLVIKDGDPYVVVGDMGTTMAGMVNIGGLPVSISTLQDKCITFGDDGRLHTPNGEPVRIRDSDQRRKPIKLTFGEKKKC